MLSCSPWTDKMYSSSQEDVEPAQLKYLMHPTHTHTQSHTHTHTITCHTINNKYTQPTHAHTVQGLQISLSYSSTKFFCKIASNTVSQWWPTIMHENCFFCKITICKICNPKKFCTVQYLLHTHMHAYTYTHNAFYYSHTQTP